MKYIILTLILSLIIGLYVAVIGASMRYIEPLTVVGLKVAITSFAALLVILAVKIFLDEY